MLFLIIFLLICSLNANYGDFSKRRWVETQDGKHRAPNEDQTHNLGLIDLARQAY